GGEGGIRTRFIPHETTICKHGCRKAAELIRHHAGLSCEEVVEIVVDIYEQRAYYKTIEEIGSGTKPNGRTAELGAGEKP
ncbi:MAG: hypothetical protein PHX38_09465, partial [Sulfuricella sp.]|nr:hypothetical protein [Sulfuricella sp.]